MPCKDPRIQRLIDEAVETVIANINSETEKRNWNRNTLINLTDTSSGTASAWFTAHAVPSLKNLVRICDVFEISLSRLFAKNESELADAQKTELLSEFDRLSEEQRTALLNFIKHAM